LVITTGLRVCPASFQAGLSSPTAHIDGSPVCTPDIIVVIIIMRRLLGDLDGTHFCKIDHIVEEVSRCAVGEDSTFYTGQPIERLFVVQFLISIW